MLRSRPKSSDWHRDSTGTWWRPATVSDTEAVFMDAADGNGFVLAGSPEEADRIDLAAFGEPSTVANVLEDAAKLAALGLILAALTITATGAAEWLERL